MSMLQSTMGELPCMLLLLKITIRSLNFYWIQVRMEALNRCGRTALDDATHGHHNRGIRLFKRGKSLAPSPGNSVHHPDEKEVAVRLLTRRC